MNLHGLKIFHAIAITGSVTRAAGLLRISQPAVTMQVRQLERELELPLLAPKGRGILLTEAGELLASHAARLFALEAETVSAMADYREGRLGRLRIAATYLPANFLLPPAGSPTSKVSIRASASPCKPSMRAKRCSG